MVGRGRVWVLMSIGLACWPARGWASDLDPGIDVLQHCVVRLYGLKAGLSAGYGSGVLVSDDGLVVTVESLLLDSENLRAVTSDGTTYGAKILEVDDDTQLALLRLESMPQYDRRGRLVPANPIRPGRFPFLTPGDSHALTPGDPVLAGGNPFKVAEGEETVSVALGVFSIRTNLDAQRKTREFPYYGDVLVIDAIVSTPGMPGGALVTMDGDWVGLIGRQVICNRTHTNLNYAIPVEVVSRFVESVLNPSKGREDAAQAAAVEPYHGIKLFELGYRKKLVYVDRVHRNSPAKKAGLRKDDLIVSIAGRQVEDIEGFARIMRSLPPGRTVELVVIRDDALKMLSLTLEEPK